MTLLAIDTCSDRCAVALRLDDDRCLAASEQMARGHAERLPGMIADLLDEAAVGYGDLDRIAVTVGPGSFTGIRVGLSLARGLGLVLKVPVVGISTLEALAHTARMQGLGSNGILALIDARRGELYTQAFDGDERPLCSAVALAVDEVLPEMSRLIGAQRSDGLAIVGSGAALLLLEHPEIAGRIPADAPQTLQVEAVAELGALTKSGDAPARPLYIRPPDAKPAPLTSRVARI